MKMICFSYLPGKPDPITIHNVEGITLDVSVEDRRYFKHNLSKLFQQSRDNNEYQVFLKQLTQASTGRYRCEVSGEAPMFATDSAFGDLLVVVVPQNGPSIDGEQDRR